MVAVLCAAVVATGLALTPLREDYHISIAVVGLVRPRGCWLHSPQAVLGSVVAVALLHRFTCNTEAQAA